MDRNDDIFADLVDPHDKERQGKYYKCREFERLYNAACNRESEVNKYIDDSHSDLRAFA